MNDKLLGYLIDPIMSKILLEINRSGRMTVKDLCARCTDIPRSSMYRHLTRLERDGLIEVVDRRQVRGTVEKTYAMCEGAFPRPDEKPPVMDGNALVGMFTAYCVEFIKMFQAFAASGPDPMRTNEVMSFYTAPIYVTDKEAADALERIGGIITELSKNGYAEGRKPHSVGLILSPPTEDVRSKESLSSQ